MQRKRTIGQRYGKSSIEFGMRPLCGAHQRSQPQYSFGMTSARPSTCASASASRTCFIWWFTSAKWPSLEFDASSRERGTSASNTRKPPGGS